MSDRTDRWIAAVAVLACCIGCAAPDRGALALDLGPALALDGVTLLDPVNGSRGPVSVVMQGDRVVEIVEAQSVEIPDRVARVDASGHYLLPGLWDLHTHLVYADPHAPALLVSQGVTGVRDLGAPLEETDALRDRIARGELLGPRIVRTGPTLNGAPNGPHHRVIESAEAARRAVGELDAAGVDLLKTHNATGREAYFALLEAAEGADLAVAGHVPTSVEPLEACAAGQASVEHVATLFEGTYIARFETELEAFLGMPAWLESEAPNLVSCFAERETLFVPTLRAYEIRARRAALWDEPDSFWRYLSADGYRGWRESSEPSEVDRRPEVIELRHSLVETGIGFVRLLHEAGAPIGAGTDLSGRGSLPGRDLHAEIRLLALAGLSPREALRTATRGPGTASGGDPLQGQIVAGAPADLVLFEASPFEELSALASIRGVVLRGEYHDRAALDAVLADLEGSHP